ncbi:chloramphenicol phosphotransferase CPT [Kribbella sancticallisti]
MIILNGGSSSGKSGIVRCLQAVLKEPWLAFGVDGFVDAMPAAMDEGIEFGPSGEVVVGPAFRKLEAAWMSGIVAMCRAGANVIIDDVFLGGSVSQSRWAKAVGDLEVVWVGVRCDAEVAAGREIARGDRVGGMAASQAVIVHEGVKYDVEVDTTRTESIDCARAIAKYVSG